MSLVRVLLVFSFVLIGISGCNLFTKPSEQDDTNRDTGSDVWYNNRINEEQNSAALNANRPQSADESDNMQTNVGLQP